MQHEGADTESSRALSAGDDAFNNNENWWSSSFCDSIPFGEGGRAAAFFLVCVSQLQV